MMNQEFSKILRLSAGTALTPNTVSFLPFQAYLYGALVFLSSRRWSYINTELKSMILKSEKNTDSCAMATRRNIITGSQSICTGKL